MLRITALSLKYMFNKPHFKLSSFTPKIIPIESLSDLIEKKQSLQMPNLDKHSYTPLELFMNILKSLKQSLYQQPEYQKKILSCLKKYKEQPQYMKLMLQILLPADGMFIQLQHFYLSLSIKYLQMDHQLNDEQIYYLVENLERMIIEIRTEWTDDNWIIRDYTNQSKMANMLIPKILELKHLFQIPFFIKLTRICNMLGVLNPNIANYLSQEMRNKQSRLKLKDIIYIMLYLSKMKVFPIQYFYNNKNKWIQTISSYNKYSSKKSFESIKLFQIFILQNVNHCQNNIKMLQNLLLQAVPSFDNIQISTLLLLCSKAKFIIKKELMQKILYQILQSIDYMGIMELCILVRGFAKFHKFYSYQHICIRIINKIDEMIGQDKQYEKQIIKQIKQLNNKKMFFII